MKFKFRICVFITAVFLFVSAFSGITAQAAEINSSIPMLQIVTQPQSVYHNGEKVTFTVTSPNYEGEVQYRVILYNGTTKKTSELWDTPESGFYYTGWMPSGSYEFTIHWPVHQMEPGAYKLTVLVKRAGTDAELDSYIDTRPFWVVGDAVITKAEKGFPIDEEAYTLVNTHTYEIIDKITVKASKDSKFELSYNIGSFSQSPYQEDLDLRIEGPGAVMNTTKTGNKILNASSSIKAGETITYTVVRKIKSSGIKYIKDISETQGDYTKFPDYGRYTSPEEKIESGEPAIIKKAEELFEGITNPFLKAKKAYEFVNYYMTYDSDNGNKSALSALNTSRGVCEDYSELFAALLRAEGIPVRIATGYWIEPSNFEGESIDGSQYRHSWPEFYIPEYGWIVAEPTQTYTINGQKGVNYDWFANLSESDHFIQGYDLDGEYRDGTVSSTFQSSSQHNDVDTQIRTYIRILE